MTTAFRFQTAPGDEPLLLDDLKSLADGARRGGLVMAWANAPGIAALLEAAEFRPLLERGTLDVIVGLDSITDLAAVRRLQALDVANTGFTVSAYLNPARGLFHPKVAWFDDGTELRMVVGSGNLTMGGLTKNWEAYAISLLAGADRTQTLNGLIEWRAQLEPNLRDLDDPEVLARAALNVGNEALLRRRPRPEATREPLADATMQVLICEIPMQTGRQGQANVAKEHYENFFGFVVGTARQATFYRVDDGGGMDPPEVRRSVQVRSQNYRIELSGMRGFTYSVAQRPIGVFVAAGERDFLYMVLTPGSPHYTCVSDALSRTSTTTRPSMRRALLTMADLRAACPTVPLLASTKPAI